MKNYIKSGVVALGVSGLFGGVAHAEDVTLEADIMIFNSLCSEFGGSMKDHPFCESVSSHYREYNSDMSPCSEKYLHALNEASEKYSDALSEASEKYLDALRANGKKKLSNEITTDQLNLANYEAYEMKAEANNAAYSMRGSSYGLAYDTKAECLSDAYARYKAAAGKEFQQHFPDGLNLKLIMGQ